MPKLQWIGILGGTFDPVHYGHLHTASAVKNSLQLDAMRLMPCAVPVHREAPVANAQQRLALLKLATAEFPALKIDETEIQRGGKSFMVDTLKALHQQQQNTEICLLMGADAFNNFQAWKEWQIILELAHLIIMRRPGHQIEKDSASSALLQERGVQNVRELKAKSAGGILLYDVKPYDVSSSEIRRRIQAGETIENLLPEAVSASIKRLSLYQ